MRLKLLIRILVGAILVHKLVNPVCVSNSGPIFAFPRNDVIVREGESVNASCGLITTHPKAKGKTVDDLIFYSLKEKKEIRGEEYLENVAKFQIKMIPSGFHQYTCQFRDIHLNSTTDCSINILAGTPPKPAVNFTCLFFNFENLTCTWNTLPNVIPTKYKLLLGQKKLQCPHQEDQEGHICKFSRHSTPPYVPGTDVTEIHIEGENVLGNTTQSFNVSEYENVVPDAPKMVSVTNLGADKLQFRYFLPLTMQNFKPGFHVKFEYQTNSSTYTDVILSSPQTPTNLQTFVLSQLCPNTQYRVAVYLKAASSKLTKPWSAPSFIVGTTLKSKGEIEKFNITVEPNTVHVSWNFCVDPRGFVKYVVEYCPIKHDVSYDDSIKEIFLNVKNPRKTLKGLIPATQFLLTVEAQYQNPAKNKQWSTTFTSYDEVPPPMPTNLQVIDEGETTLTINWTVPPKAFGNYHLHCYGDKFFSSNLNPLDGQHIITGLQCGTMYECSMGACSTVCSNFTSSVLGKTKMEIDRVNVTSIVMTSNSANIFWEEPDHTCEEITSYEIKGAVSMRERVFFVDKTIHSEILKDGPLEAKFSVGGCYTVKFAVRARIVRGDTVIDSDWSDWHELDCIDVSWKFFLMTCTLLSMFLLLLAFIGVAVLRVAEFSYYLKRRSALRRTEEAPVELRTISRICDKENDVITEISV